MQAPQQQINLKDIHLPDAVSWWPPAIGYWLIIAVILIIIMIFFGMQTLRKRSATKRSALKEYSLIKDRYQSNANKKQLVTSLSELLRRAAISSYPLTDCASLTGKQWLTWLDKQLPNTKITFINGPGYLLTNFNYSDSKDSGETGDIDNLLELSLSWLKKLPASTGSNS